MCLNDKLTKAKLHSAPPPPLCREPMASPGLGKEPQPFPQILKYQRALGCEAGKSRVRGRAGISQVAGAIDCAARNTVQKMQRMKWRGNEKPVGNWKQASFCP